MGGLEYPTKLPASYGPAVLEQPNLAQPGRPSCKEEPHGHFTDYANKWSPHALRSGALEAVPEINREIAAELVDVKEPPEHVNRELSSRSAKSTGLQKNFPAKLFDMLNDTKAQRYIHWTSDGKSFAVENQDNFAKYVQPRYLKTGNFPSFIRQLNMYGFHKTNRALRSQRGPETQEKGPEFVFQHPKFQQDRPDLLSEIKRKGTEDHPPYHASLPLFANAMSDPTSFFWQPPTDSVSIHEFLSVKQENETLRNINEFLELRCAELSEHIQWLQSALRLPDPSSASIAYAAPLVKNTLDQLASPSADNLLPTMIYVQSTSNSAEEAAMLNQTPMATPQAAPYKSQSIATTTTTSPNDSSLPKTISFPVGSPGMLPPSSLSEVSITPQGSPTQTEGLGSSWPNLPWPWSSDQLLPGQSQRAVGPTATVNRVPSNAHMKRNAGSRGPPVVTVPVVPSIPSLH
ncbi:hypothetical protein FRB90_006424 [Tulasnella sp. 427]|nr:hypothetical protein FRB90_006424 [Tulasnella sp. 427]